MFLLSVTRAYVDSVPFAWPETQLSPFPDGTYQHILTLHSSHAARHLYRSD